MIGLYLGIALSWRPGAGGGSPPSTAGQPVGLLLLLTKAS